MTMNDNDDDDDEDYSGISLNQFVCYRSLWYISSMIAYKLIWSAMREFFLAIIIELCNSVNKSFFFSETNQPHPTNLANDEYMVWFEIKESKTERKKDFWLHSLSECISNFLAAKSDWFWQPNNKTWLKELVFWMNKISSPFSNLLILV